MWITVCLLCNAIQYGYENEEQEQRQKESNEYERLVGVACSNWNDNNSNNIRTREQQQIHFYHLLHNNSYILELHPNDILNTEAELLHKNIKTISYSKQ